MSFVGKLSYLPTQATYSGKSVRANRKDFRSAARLFCSSTLYMPELAFEPFMPREDSWLGPLSNRGGSTRLDSATADSLGKGLPSPEHQGAHSQAR